MAKRTPEATLKELRKICAALDDYSEGTHFDSIAFKAGGKMFATFRVDGDDSEIVFQLAPEHTDALLASDEQFSRYPRAAKAIQIRGSAIDDWKQMGHFLAESHALAVPKKGAKAKTKAAPEKKKR